MDGESSIQHVYLGLAWGVRTLLEDGNEEGPSNFAQWLRKDPVLVRHRCTQAVDIVQRGPCEDGGGGGTTHPAHTRLRIGHVRGKSLDQARARNDWRREGFVGHAGGPATCSLEEIGRE